MEMDGETKAPMCTGLQTMDPTSRIMLFQVSMVHSSMHKIQLYRLSHVRSRNATCK